MRKIFDKDCTFLQSISKPEQFEQYYFQKPEVVFAGRSNAGKSSLLNALVHANNLAHVSKTPGKTKTINAFSLSKSINLLDMPGYGYAVVSKVQRAEWHNLISGYFAMNRPQLLQVFVLMDGRVGMKDSDLEMMSYLPMSVTTIVLTKCDKMSQKEMEVVKNEIMEFMIVNFSLQIPVLFTSAKTGLGIDQLRVEIHNLL